MTSDRELLELAAKAAGYPFDDGHFEEAKTPNAWWGWIYFDSSGEPPNDSAWVELWNPLTDDGDALRLAVKLGFVVDTGAISTAVHANNGERDIGFEWHNNDPYAATRRAITRAAAEIGRSM